MINHLTKQQRIEGHLHIQILKAIVRGRMHDVEKYKAELKEVQSIQEEMEIVG